MDRASHGASRSTVAVVHPLAAGQRGGSEAAVMPRWGASPACTSAVVQHTCAMSLLTCPLCGEEQDPSGPGVSSQRSHASREWVSYWTPFIEDIRGNPQRLVHPACFVKKSGFDALLALVTENDRRMRLELSKRG